MEDIVQSRQRAMIRQGWLFGDKTFRIGHPVEWIDAERQSYIYSARDVRALLQAISMYYEEYPTPDKIRTSDHDQMLGHYEKTMARALRYFAPFLSDRSEWQNHLRCTSVARTQDYCAIKTFSKALPSSPTHLDLGPGLGSHAVYSLEGLKGTYIALEAIPHMYDIQRQFLRFLAADYGTYLDVIECENFSFEKSEIVQELSKKSSHRIRHVPSWYFPEVADSSVDLITATWVLNEVSYASILWLLAHAGRVLKEGGYFYIRDSFKLKPGRHTIPYDQVLEEQGFTQVGMLTVQNRVDFWGTPRVYQLTKRRAGATFEKFADEYLGKFAIVSHGGTYNQNLDSLPKKGTS